MPVETVVTSGEESHSGKRKAIWKKNVVPALLSIGFLLFVVNVYRYNETNAEAARAEWSGIVDGAGEAIRARMLEWSGITESQGQAILWSGAKSEILYIQYEPSNVTSKDELADVRNPPSWRVWAKSASGVYFTVRFTFNTSTGFLADRMPVTVTEADFVRLLVAYGKLDLIEKYKLPMRPA